MDFGEETMGGGNVNEVVRIGNTVRRTACGNPLLRELLTHLKAQGFTGAPEYLGMDEQGRDIFSFLPGEAAGNDYPDNAPYMWSDDSLTGIARLLRGFHDASKGLAAPLPEKPRVFPGQWIHEVICHNDAALYNVIFHYGRPSALIDFDMAAAGPRIWDIAYALYTCVPLAGFEPDGRGRTEPYKAAIHAAGRKRRLRLFMDTYGMDAPGDLMRIVIARIAALCDTLETEAARGNAAFVKMVGEGHLDHYRAEIGFLEDHFEEWI